LDTGSGTRDSGSTTLMYSPGILVPGDQRTSSQYVKGGRGLMKHALALGSSDDGGHWYFAYMGASPRRDNDARLKTYELAYDWQVRLYDNRITLVNPFVRARLGGAYLSGTDVTGALIEGGDHFGLTAAASFGAEVSLASFFLLSASAGHDWMWSGAEANLSGYIVNLGAIFRL
jgi:hypothetical protein